MRQFLSLDHGAVWRLAGPMILTNLSIALLGLVDTAVVGHLNQPFYLGAVALAGVIFDFLYWSMGFLRMSTTGLVAQAHGRGDGDRVRAALAQGLLFAGGVGALLLLVQTPLVGAALWFLGGSEEVRHFTRVYFQIAIWSSPAVLWLLVIFGWFVGMQNTRAPLVIAVTVNAVNIVLDLALVFGFGLGVKGVAWASLLSELGGLAMALYLVRDELRFNPGRWRRSLIVEADSLRRMVALNQNIFVRTLCLVFSFAFFTRQGARQGDVILAANAILLNLQSFMALALDGFANALEALVGRAVGAGRRADFIRAVYSAGGWSILFAVAFAVLYGGGGWVIVASLTDLEKVRGAALSYLPWIAVSPLISVWCFTLDGIFIGATRGTEMRNSMLVATFMVFVPAWYLLRGLGNHGLWLAFLIFLAARGLTLGAVFLHIERGEGFIAPAAP